MGNRLILLVLSVFISSAASAKYSLQKLVAHDNKIEDDLRLILKKAKLPLDTFSFSRTLSSKNSVKIICNQKTDHINLQVSSLEEEWTSTLYIALQKMGFLFPHPRIQISPTLSDIKTHCDQTYLWRPALKYRGSHLHTLHASEWVDGFLMGKEEIAVDLIRWLLRNNQNIFDLSLVRMEDQEIIDNLLPLFNLSRELGVHPGITIGVAFHQQNTYKLVSLWGSLFDSNSRDQIKENLPKLAFNLPISFLNVEMGTSEFTPVSYERMLSWLNQIGKMTSERNIQMLTKVHASTNQTNEKYGNFNFLPQFANKEVGILPHTVFYHALEDPKAPLYGNQNFEYMKNFMLKENSKRMTWYYPETSYYIGLDIDIPLLITEYLRTRSQDMKLLYENKIPGMINFTTGHENAYWLMDWSVTLYNNLEYNFDPLTGLKLLNQDLDFWKKYLNFQKKHFTDEGLISIITFSNGGDELAPKHKILERNLLKELKSDSNKLRSEIEKLKHAIKEIPSLPKIAISIELKHHIQITNIRISHALAVRQALLNKHDQKLKKSYLNSAKRLRETAQEHMELIKTNFNRYPESFVYKRQKNPTAYAYGYGYTSSKLHYWKREEMMVKDNNFSAFYMNIWNFIDIIF